MPRDGSSFATQFLVNKLHCNVFDSDAVQVDPCRSIVFRRCKTLNGDEPRLRKPASLLTGRNAPNTASA
jgi:hypothetical protein